MQVYCSHHISMKAGGCLSDELVAFVLLAYASGLGCFCLGHLSDKLNKEYDCVRFYKLSRHQLQ